MLQSAVAGGLDGDQRDLSVWLIYIIFSLKFLENHLMCFFVFFLLPLLSSYIQSAVLNLQAKVALLEPSHVSAIGGQLQVSPVFL